MIDRLNYYQPFTSDDSFYTYEFFLSPGCVLLLGKSKLIRVCAMFNINPLEYYFLSLDKDHKDYLMFSFFEFMLSFNPTKEISTDADSLDSADVTPLLDEEDDM